MFLINSRHPLVCAPHTWLPKHGAPFSRSYGGNLPSSFNTVLSSASVCSTSPQCRFRVRSLCRRCFLEGGHSRPNPIRDDTLTPSSRPGRLGSINPIPIGYGFRPRLRGPANPARINLAQEPLDFRRAGFSPALTLLMSAFALPIPPACLTACLRRPTERSATACHPVARRHTRSFGAWL